MKKTALTFSSYTNAYALYLGSKELGVDFYTTDKNRTFPIPYKDAVEADFLAFTEEASLKNALDGRVVGSFSPQDFPLAMLDDKWALVEWLADYPNLIQGIKQWHVSDYESATFPCLLKAKHSWQGSTKLPRGWICRSASELEEYLLEAKKFEDWQDVFFIQEWLGDKKCKVISVCGFHDHTEPQRNLSVIAKRIASHNEGLSCSAAVETVADSWGLVQKNTAILDTLEFTGPYEMEFLLADGEFRVLELNPRFWMQHAIFLKHGNGLIKRYYDLDTESDWADSFIPHTVWIDTVHLLTSLVRLRFDFLRFTLKQIKVNKKAVLLWPSIPMAALVVGKRVASKLRSKMKSLA